MYIYKDFQYSKLLDVGYEMSSRGLTRSISKTAAKLLPTTVKS